VQMKAFPYIIAGLILSLSFGTGCASIGARQDQAVAHLYPGIRDDAYYLFHPSQADYPALQWLNVLDLPFSAVADTFMIPVDLSGDPYWWVPQLQPGTILGSWGVK